MDARAFARRRWMHYHDLKQAMARRRVKPGHDAGCVARVSKRFERYASSARPVSILRFNFQTANIAFSQRSAAPFLEARGAPSVLPASAGQICLGSQPRERSAGRRFNKFHALRRACEACRERRAHIFRCVRLPALHRGIYRRPLSAGSSAISPGPRFLGRGQSAPCPSPAKLLAERP